jgi:putative transposase
MAYTNGPFKDNVWYHCYNQCIDGRVGFVDIEDYRRFLEILYLANDDVPLRRGDFRNRTFEDILSIPGRMPLVGIGAFCLMPNHFHLILKEVSAGGITSFMRKIGTSYTQYFNARHGRAGNLFLKPFRSETVSPEDFERAVSYVHCSPATLYEPEWKTRAVVDAQFLGQRIAEYPYSSLGAYLGKRTPTRNLLAAHAIDAWHPSPIQKMLRAALQYRADAGIP